VILSGAPFRINKKTCTVRFMFHNQEDIAWFKPVELRSKYGRRGHITEHLGTHGHFKVRTHFKGGLGSKKCGTIKYCENRANTVYSG